MNSERQRPALFTSEEMESLVRTGPGTVGNELMSYYWHPVALSREIEPCHTLPVRAFGNDYVLFRDPGGQLAMLDRVCPHRGADLAYGRCDEGGLRCTYHGWMFGADGSCLEQPAEPAKSRFREQIRIEAPHVREGSGLVFTNFRRDEAPPFPSFEFLDVPAERAWAGKVYHDCGYLQGNEGNLDQSHIGFLHFFPTGSVGVDTFDTSAPGSESRPAEITDADKAPRIATEQTRYGFREYTERQTPEGDIYLKVQSFLMPNAAVFPGIVQGVDGFQIHWHVPIDDESHWKFILVFQRDQELDHEAIGIGLVGTDELDENYRPKRTRENLHLQDRAEMKRSPGWAGFGSAFEIQDMAIVESEGKIQDFSRENLGYGDRSVIAIRRTMLEAIECVRRGDAPASAIVDEHENDGFPDLAVVAEVVPKGTDVRAHYARQIEERRRERL